MIEREKRNVDTAIDSVNKLLGKGTIGKLGSMEGQDIETFSSGSAALDNVLGGGWCIGRMVEIYGPESSGKTTAALHAIAEVQKSGGVAGMIDLEHALDPSYAERIGVNISELIFSQPDSGDDAWRIIDVLLDSGGIDLLVIDSVPAMVPEKILKGEISDANIGLHAKMMTQGLSRSLGKVKKTNTTVMFINQLRDNVGVVYGPSEITTGGRALKFYLSQRVEVRRSEVLTSGEDSIGQKVRVKAVKNKIAPPYRVGYVNLMYGKGFDKISDMLEVCVETEIVTRGGSWYSYGETRLGQGFMNVVKLLEDNPELVDELQLQLDTLRESVDTVEE